MLYSCVLSYSTCVWYTVSWDSIHDQKVIVDLGIRVEGMKLGLLEIVLIALGNLLILGAAFAAVMFVARAITSRPACSDQTPPSKPCLCPKCGNNLLPDSDACSACGARLHAGGVKSPESSSPPRD